MLKKTALFLILVLFASISANNLDSEYSKEFTDLVELVYGSDYLSQGAEHSVDLMFEGESLDNKMLFDIGSGLGGVDFYLAQKYKVDITCIDRVSRLIDDANNRKSNYNLKGEVNFYHQETDTDLSKYDSSNFDIVFAKESILHVEDKLSLLKEVYRILKPGGKLVILDWCLEKKELGPTIKHMMEIDGLDLKMATVSEYQAHLSALGFQNVSTENMNKHSIDYTLDNIKQIQAKQADIIKAFGKNTYSYSLKTWNMQKQIFENNEVVVTLIKATKPI